MLNRVRWSKWVSFYFYLLLNVVLLSLFSGFQAKGLLEVAHSKTTSTEVLFLVAYVFFLALSVSLVWLIVSTLLFPLLSRHWTRLLLYFATILFETCLFFYLVVDGMIFKLLGIHVESDFALDAMLNPGFQKEAHISGKTYASLVVLVIFLLLAQGALLFFCKRQERWNRRTSRVLAISVGALFLGLGGFSVSHVNGMLKTAQREGSSLADVLPLYERVNSSSSSQMRLLRVRYPRGLGKILPKIKRRKNIVFIMAESFRGDFMREDRMPHMMRFIKNNDCITSKYHYSGGHSTTWGMFSMFYGLFSYHMKFFFYQNVDAFPIKVLKQNGYQTAGFIASRMKGWDHGGIVGRQLKPYRELTGFKSFENDRNLVKAVKKFYKTRDPKKPFFLFLFLDSTHHNYLYPPEFEINKPVMPENYNHFMANHKLRKLKNKVLNRYKNSVLYVDHTFSLLMDIFKKDRKKDNLIVAMTGDHGEEFWDHGLLGHGAPRFINARTQVPLLFCLPNIKPRHHHVTSHVDFWPTVMDYVGLSPKVPVASYSDGHSLLKKLPKNRYIIITSYGYPKNRKLALINDKNKFWLRWKGQFNRFRVTRVSDLEDRIQKRKPSQKVGAYLKKLEKNMMRFFFTKRILFDKEPPVQHRVEAHFGPYVRLVGFDLKKQPLAGGKAFTVRYVFQALREIPKGWKLFFHVKSTAPKRFHNADHIAVNGMFPLYKWKPGQYIIDEHNIRLPRAFLPNRPLSLHMGMWASGRGRLPIHIQNQKLRSQFSIKRKSIRLLTLRLDR